MNLPDAIEHLRRMHAESVECREFCERLRVPEHARDGGALLREVSPKTYAPRPGGNGK